ncbi:Nuclear pore complex protein NUP107 [Camellia lanceoleosa]|uniref:Nuclear pore complex protein NUP107 n=1 Tax=Camellia lanceoleosa TaxID=1840588 RepID=A0ACC0IFV0_9ERIC|nr:Nuclear pore complex protein NUP107 [Camellia lanceoleosa]
METSPSYFDPEDLNTRERYRRYGKRHSTSSHDNSVSKFSGTRILYDGQSIERRPNAALFLKISNKRYGSNERQRIVKDKLMRQKARLMIRLLLGNEELPEDLMLSPTTSLLEACQFVVADHTAKLGLRIVQWLEGSASKVLDLDNEVMSLLLSPILTV